MNVVSFPSIVVFAFLFGLFYTVVVELRVVEPVALKLSMVPKGKVDQVANMTRGI